MRRPLLALPLVLASALVLVGCATGEPETDPTDDTVATDVCATPSGDATAAVQVGGDFGTAPTVEFTAPLTVDTTERAVLVEGDAVQPGTSVQAAYALYNGTTGDELEVFGWADGDEAVAFRADLAVLQEGFARTLGCLGPGSRAVGVIPAGEGFGAQGASVGLGEDDTLVFVVDVLADLSPVEWTTDLPEIDDSGSVPVVTIPAVPAKTTLELVVLTEGDGETVGAADSVTVNYHGVAWETGEVFDSSFERGSPATFSVTGVVQGFSQALIGQKVGSRVLVTMPPALGYGGNEGHELQHSTLVFLIDIISTTAG